MKVRAQSISKSLKLKRIFLLDLQFCDSYIYNLKGFLAFRFSIYNYDKLKGLKLRVLSLSFILSLALKSLCYHRIVSVQLFTIFTEYFSLNIQSVLVYITQQFNKRVFKIPCKCELQEIARPNHTQIVPFSFPV